MHTGIECVSTLSVQDERDKGCRLESSACQYMMKWISGTSWCESCCMAARRNVIELYFGRSKHVGARVDKKQAFSGPTSKKEGILNHTSLRPIARTEFDVLQVKSSLSDCRAYLLDFYKFETEYTAELTSRCMDIPVEAVPDICLQYAEACYDVSPCLNEASESYQQVLPVSQEWHGSGNEVHVREHLYRHWKRHDCTNSRTLSHFDELVDNCLQKNKVCSETDVELKKIVK